MESEFNKLPLEFQENITNSKILLNGFVHEDSPEQQTASFDINGITKEAVFKLIELEDGTKQYEFDYLAY